jgi:hypothetical protein
MFKIFKPDTLYIRIDKRKIEIRNLNTGLEAIKEPNKKYSNSRLIIADFIAAEECLREVIQEVGSKGLIKILLQPIDENINDYSQVEIRCFKDFSEHAGAK